MKPFEALYQQDSKFYFRNEKGQINTIPINKFSHNEIVKGSSKHYSKTTFVMLTEPTYTETRGWVYGIHFINRQGGGSGASFAYEENNFEKLDNTRDILYANRYYAKATINKLKKELLQKESELEKIEYCLSISVYEYDKVEKDCHKCGKLFHTHGEGGNYNRDLCIECDQVK